MSLPTGFRTPDGFVCWACRHPDMPQHGAGIRLDARVASGKECIRCGDKMPYLARVRLLPDGASEVAVKDHALLYLTIGCGPELGVEMTPGGQIKLWVHIDPDGDEPAGCWEFDPFAEPTSGDKAGGDRG